MPLKFYIDSAKHAEANITAQSLGYEDLDGWLKERNYRYCSGCIQGACGWIDSKNEPVDVYTELQKHQQSVGHSAMFLGVLHAKIGELLKTKSVTTPVVINKDDFDLANSGVDDYVVLSEIEGLKPTEDQAHEETNVDTAKD